MQNGIYDYRDGAKEVNYIAGPMLAVMAVLVGAALLFQLVNAKNSFVLIMMIPMLFLELLLIFGSWSLLSAIGLSNSGGVEITDEGVFDMRSGGLFRWEEIHSFKELNLRQRVRFYGTGGEVLFDVHRSLENSVFFKEHVAKKMAHCVGRDEVLRTLPGSFSVLGETVLRGVPTFLMITFMSATMLYKPNGSLVIYVGIVAVFVAVSLALSFRDTLRMDISETGMAIRTWFSSRRYRFDEITSVRLGERHLSVGKRGKWIVPELRLTFEDRSTTAFAGKPALRAFVILKQFVKESVREKRDYVAELEQFDLLNGIESNKNQIELEL